MLISYTFCNIFNYISVHLYYQQLQQHEQIWYIAVATACLVITYLIM